MTDIYSVRLSADSRDIRTAKREVDSLDRSGARAQRTFSSATRTISAFASALAIGQTFRAVIANTIEQERVTAQLEATLRSTGRYTPELSQSLQDYAAQLQTVTTFGDEAIIGAQSLLLTFTRIGDEAFPRATQAILDTATAMGQDLRTSTIQIGKALNDPVLGLTALSRSGIQFSDTQKEMIKDMVAVGDVAGAQSIILKELETQFGGSARAARDTFGGAIQGLKNAFGDLLEAKGGLPEAQQRMESLTATLQDPAVVSAVDSLTSAMITGFSHATTAIAGTNVVIDALVLDFLKAQRAIWEMLNAAREWNISVREILISLRLSSNTEGLEDARRIAAEQQAILAQIEADIESRLGSGALSLEAFENIYTGLSAARDKFIGGAGVDVPVVGSVDSGALEEGTAELQSELDWRLEIAANNAQRQAEEQLAWEEYRINELRRLRDEERAQEATDKQATAIIESLLSEEEAIALSYERRREILLSSTIATNEDLIALENDKNARLQELEAERTQQTYQNYADLYDGIAGVAKAFAGEQSGIYRAMFAVSKAFSIAESIVAIQTGIAKAAANPWPENLAAMASVAAATSGIISTIASTNPSFEGGGFTGYGSRSGGVDGRGGFPAVLHPNETVIDHTKGGGQQPNPVRIINVLDPSVVGDYLDTDAGEEIIMNVVRRNQGGQ